MEGARRLLGCSLCGLEWPFSRILCPACFEEDPYKLPIFRSEPHPTVRIEACETCRRYVKSIDLSEDARPIPEVDDLVSHLDGPLGPGAGLRADRAGNRRRLTVKDALSLLNAAQRALRSRLDDFRRAFGNRDQAAYVLALADFHECLQRWTLAEEKALLPALRRAGFPDRDPQRELSLAYVQLRELSRHLRMQIETRAPMADILGLIENLSRRFDCARARKPGGLLSGRRHAVDARGTSGPRRRRARLLSGLAELRQDRLRCPPAPRNERLVRARRADPAATPGARRRPGRRHGSGRDLDDRDRALPFLRTDRQSPGRKRDRRFARPNRDSLEAHAAGLRESRHGGLFWRAQGLALQAKIWNRAPSTRIRSPPAASAWSAQSPEARPWSTVQGPAPVTSPR